MRNRNIPWAHYKCKLVIFKCIDERGPIISHGKNISTLYATCICVYNRWQSISLTRVLDSFLLYCSQCIPPSSQGVPSKFLMCSPVLFPIISHFYPICLAQRCSLSTSQGWPKRALGELALVLGGYHI